MLDSMIREREKVTLEQFYDLLKQRKIGLEFDGHGNVCERSKLSKQTALKALDVISDSVLYFESKQVAVIPDTPVRLVKPDGTATIYSPTCAAYDKKSLITQDGLVLSKPLFIFDALECAESVFDTNRLHDYKCCLIQEIVSVNYVFKSATVAYLGADNEYSTSVISGSGADFNSQEYPGLALHIL